ncbi:hypothetical protein [Arsenicicoccus piscis]|uniref:hypothetical protein n=1 Tax=Arsenicicoccus piscis TaxID=673954 RepID=UPI0024E067C0|nr:hypothetical protein [Arsenicicoccus piscis]
MVTFEPHSPTCAQARHWSGEDLLSAHPLPALPWAGRVEVWPCEGLVMAWWDAHEGPSWTVSLFQSWRLDEAGCWRPEAPLGDGVDVETRADTRGRATVEAVAAALADVLAVIDAVEATGSASAPGRVVHLVDGVTAPAVMPLGEGWACEVDVVADPAGGWSARVLGPDLGAGDLLARVLREHRSSNGRQWQAGPLTVLVIDPDADEHVLELDDVEQVGRVLEDLTRDPARLLRRAARTA